MKLPRHLLPCLIITVTTICYSSLAPARIKCWTNSEGVKECGDKVPPEYSQKGHQEISEQGLVVEEQERAKTPEELEEEKKIEEMRAAEERLAEEKEKQDQILLRTFGSVDELELARDGKLTAIESSISLANKRNEKLQTDMDGLLKKAAAAESSGKELPKELTQDIETLERQINNNNKFITDKRAEQESIKQAYAVDIDRFKKLKGIK